MLFTCYNLTGPQNDLLDRVSMQFNLSMAALQGSGLISIISQNLHEVKEKEIVV